MTVNRLARLSNTSPYAVRYYTRIGLLKPRRNMQNGYKMYADSDVAQLRFIRRAKSLGFTLQEIAEILHESGQGKSPCPMARQIIERRIEENRRALNELIELQARMEEALARWSKMPDGVPDGDTVCHLIETSEKP